MTYSFDEALALNGRLFSDQANQDAMLEKSLFQGEQIWVNDLQGSCLDVGCGSGRLLTALARRNVAIGLEIQLMPLRQCRARGLAVVQGDALQMPFPDGSFDNIWFGYHTIEFVGPSHETALAEAKRCLAPGGRLVISFHDRRLYSPVSWITSRIRSPAERPLIKRDGRVRTNAGSFPGLAMWLRSKPSLLRLVREEFADPEVVALHTGRTAKWLDGRRGLLLRATRPA